jgi:iron complex transport system substrate-binding protein
VSVESGDKTKGEMMIIKIFLFSILGLLSHPIFADAERIVVSGGSITEIVYALGQQDKIVGLDSTSVFPASATTKPQIGYVRRIGVEGVLALQPDLLIGEADTGPEKSLKQLQDMGVKTVILSAEDNFEHIEEKVIKVAKLLGAQQQAAPILVDIKHQRTVLDGILATRDKPAPKVLFVLSARSGQPLAAGTGTSADQVITAAGGLNVTANFAGWKPLSVESAAELNPDIIVMMGNHGSNNSDNLAKLPHFQFSNAIKNQQVFTFDGAYLLGMGPRTPQAVVELASLFYLNGQLPQGYQFSHAKTAQSASL